MTLVRLWYAVSVRLVESSVWCHSDVPAAQQAHGSHFPAGSHVGMASSSSAAAAATPDFDVGGIRVGTYNVGAHADNYCETPEKWKIFSEYMRGKMRVLWHSVAKLSRAAIAAAVAKQTGGQHTACDMQQTSCVFSSLHCRHHCDVLGLQEVNSRTEAFIEKILPRGWQSWTAGKLMMLHDTKVPACHVE